MLKTINLVLVGLLIAGAGWTFMVKHNAEEASERVAKLQRDISNEHDEIDLLKADWALLNSPDRLEQLVKHYNTELGLKNLDPQQIADIDDLPEMKSRLSLPQKDGGDTLQAQNQKPDLLSTGSITGRARIPEIGNANDDENDGEIEVQR